MEIAAWLILRVVYAGMFLYPLQDLLTNFEETVHWVALIAPFKPRLFAYLMILVMIFSAVMILFGIYAQIAGILLIIYNIAGIFLHYKLSRQARNARLSAQASAEDIKKFSEIAQLAMVGHITSGQKNSVFAAVAVFFMLLGSGPFSVTGLLF